MAENRSNTDVRAQGDLLRRGFEDAFAHELEERPDDRFATSLGALDASIDGTVGSKIRTRGHDDQYGIIHVKR